MADKLKLRMKTWWWGRYIEEGCYMDSTRVTRNTPDFEPYVEEEHGVEAGKPRMTPLEYELSVKHQSKWEYVTPSEHELVATKHLKGFHEGCNYLAIGYCNKCGKFISE